MPCWDAVQECAARLPEEHMEGARPSCACVRWYHHLPAVWAGDKTHLSMTAQIVNWKNVAERLEAAK